MLSAFIMLLCDFSPVIYLCMAAGGLCMLTGGFASRKQKK